MSAHRRRPGAAVRIHLYYPPAGELLPALCRCAGQQNWPAARKHTTETT